MFIRKYRYEGIMRRLQQLERQVETHKDFLHKDYNRLEQIEKTLGVPKRAAIGWDMDAISYLYGYHRQPKLTIFEKVEQLLAYLNLTVTHTPEATKLMPKPKPPTKKKKSVTKK